MTQIKTRPDYSTEDTHKKQEHVISIVCIQKR